MNRLRVGVFMGGKSIEKEVSFNSGRTICDHLDASRYAIVPIFQTTQGTLYLLPWHFLHRGKIADFEHRLVHEAHEIYWDDVKKYIDFMYIATHGRYAEDGTLQATLELLHIPYLGTKIFGSALGMNKLLQKEMLSLHGITTAKSIALPAYEIVHHKDPSDIMSKIEDASLSLPCIIKPIHEGSSLGVHVVHTMDELIPALMSASTIYEKKHQDVLIEEKVLGMEFTCIIITDHLTNTLIPLPPTEIEHRSGTEFFDYHQKYMPGCAREYTPARCSLVDIQRIQETCIEAMRALHFTNMARIDGFLTKSGAIVIIDANTLSGMAPTSFLFRASAHLNMNHTQFINHLIQTELHYYRSEHRFITELSMESTLESTIKPLKVAVLFGGNSNEKETSLESGRNIVYKLSTQRYQVIPIFLNEQLKLFRLDQKLLVCNSTEEIESLLTSDVQILWHQLPSIADFVFIALHGGVGENGSIQGMLEMLEIPYNGSSLFTSALCMDKYKTNQLLHKKGFHVPRSLLIAHTDWVASSDNCIQQIQQTFAFPIIVKPSDDGCSVLVKKVSNEQELRTHTNNLFACHKAHALVEEYIQGMELTVGVIGNKKPHALVPSYAVASHGVLSIEEKFLPGFGENQTPAPLPEKTVRLVQDTIERVYAAVHCRGYARIDCFYQNAQQSSTGQERVVIIEINTLPGLTPATCLFHQAAEMGMKPMEFIEKIIELGMEQS